MSELNKVLMADDEDLFRDTTADLLRKEGYAVDCASDAVEASRMLSAEKYDLLISDIRMPGNAHLQLVLDVCETARGLPIILVTGYPAIETAIEAVRLAVVAYLIKPVPIDELLEHVRASIVKSRLYRTVTDLRKQLKLWDDDAKDLVEVLRKPLGAGVTGPARSLLTTSFEMVTKSLIDLRRVTELLAETDTFPQRAAVEGLASTSDIVETALRETIQALEESKYVFKSKRLKELRHQLQCVLGVLERERR